MRNIFEYTKSRAQEENNEGVLKLSAERRSKEAINYSKCKEKLNFTHQFKSGETFEASEDKDGIAKFLIKKDGKEIVDFNKFLPKDVKFVTPSYINKQPPSKEISEMKKQAGQVAFLQEENAVSVGHFSDLKSILFLTHEIGHAQIRV